jgi:hypothetical protein
VWDFNKTGTFAVLEFVRRNDCKLIYAGSSTKFADGGDGRNQSPYAWIKATNTELVKNYAEWFGIEYAITYFYNVYGPRELSGSFGTVIKIFLDLYSSGQPITVTKPGTQARNFTHVNDIVAGLLLVGEHGIGDNYGIGADQSYSILEIAKMFGTEVILMPERAGTRQLGGVDNQQVKELGWKQQHHLPGYIEEMKRSIGSVELKEQRILVFTPTFYPHAKAAEWALVDIIQAMPLVSFDVITTQFEKDLEELELPNMRVYRVGSGSHSDKYLLPILGARVARALQKEHTYLFTWSLFASYGALAALFSRVHKNQPMLITLADQQLGRIPFPMSLVLRGILRSADQVYATDTREERAAISISKRRSLLRSIGSGDALASQIRFAYSNFLRKRADKNTKK